MANDVNTPSSAYYSMLADWQLIDDLMGGTTSMRHAAERWLPREPAETYAGYLARVQKTFLFNGLARTIKTLVGKPFSEDVHVAKEITGNFADYMEDLDRLGHDVTTFADQLMRIGLSKGIVHILVEYPAVPGRITLADKRTQNIRPYFVAIDPESLIGWQYVIEGNVPVLSQIRIRECLSMPDGEFGERDVYRVRVFDRIVVDGIPMVAYRLFEMQTTMQNAQEWVLIEQGDISLNFIPLATAVFSEQEGFFKVCPPLMDLAWMNVEHWQSSSDQRHILHVARVPVWFLKGWSPTLDDEGNPKDRIELGPDRMIRVTSEQADLKVVEHNGNAIEAGRTDLKDIEARMAIQGSQLLTQKTKGEKTATEESHDNKAEDSDLQRMTKSLEDALTTAIGFMYEYEGQTAPNGKLVTINTDFGLTAQDAADLQTLYQSRISGLISHPTYLKELQRRGVLAPSVDLSIELIAAKSDGPVAQPQAAITAKAGAGA